VGLYFDFASVGGKPWSSTTLYDCARPGYRRTLCAPLHRVQCDELHDVAVLAHARDNKRPKPPAGLKDCATYYLMIPSDDEKLLHQHTLQARQQAARDGYPTAINPQGKSEVAADFNLSFQRNGEALEKYASLDAYRTLALFAMLREMTPKGIKGASTKDKNWQGYQRQMAVLPCAMVMSSQGVRLKQEQIDFNSPDSLVTQLRRKYLSEKKSAETYATAVCPEAAGPDFNCQSGQQLAKVYYSEDGFCLPILTKTKKGAGLPTDNKSAQLLLRYAMARNAGDEELALSYLGPDALDITQRNYSPRSRLHRLSSRKLTAALGFLRRVVTYEQKDGFPEDNIGYKSYGTGVTYALGYLASAIPAGERYASRSWRTAPEQRWPADKPLYLFPSFNAVGITLTRFSSRDPNGQNVSKKPEIPLRKLFGPAPGRVWACIDYSQLELRLFAAASQDAALLRSFREGYDFHTFTACGMYGYNLSNHLEIPSHLRRVAKNVNFGIVYGAGPNKIAQTSGDPEAYNKYSKQFPGARAYMDGVIAGVQRTGSIHTLFGYELRVHPEPAYKGVNYVVQGTAGELVKRAMTSLYFDADSPLDWNDCRLVLNVHDELVFDLLDNATYLAQVLPVLQQKMAAVGQTINTDTPVDAKLCRVSWAEGESPCLTTIPATDAAASSSNPSAQRSSPKRSRQKSTRFSTSA
jgi:DNA polymerase I-like protein with 3'-5' exonuclease and polymerase domains